jgi:hypothetical protein
MGTTLTTMTAQEWHEGRFAEAQAYRRNLADGGTNNAPRRHRQPNRFWALVKDLASAQL